MATKVMLAYLAMGFTFAIALCLKFSASSPSNALQQSFGRDDKVWPELEFSSTVVLATVIGFLGSAFGTVGGVGGGGIFVPMLTLIIGFDAKSAAAISKCMIMAASASSFWYNLRVPHPCREAPLLDYDLALLFQPMLMLGITIGVTLSVVFPYWLITVLIIILFVGTSSRSCAKAVKMWKEETVSNNRAMEDGQKFADSCREVLIHPEEQLVHTEPKTAMQIMKDNLDLRRMSTLVLVWIVFLLLQVIKNETEACSHLYWFLSLLQLPVALAVFGYKSVTMHKESKRRKVAGNQQHICEATIDWNVMSLAFCALCGVLGGTVGGLLGSGGGFILGPLLLEIGVIPQVASATAGFVMLFSSSLSVVEFYLLNRFPIPYALYLMAVSILAGFWGQFLVRKMVTILKRTSVIVFILSAVIFASALTMGVIGIENSVKMIKNHEFMGFLDFCTSQ